MKTKISITLMALVVSVWPAILVQPVNIIDPVNSGTAIYIYWKTATDATIFYGFSDFSQSKAGTARGGHLTGLVPGARYQYKVVCNTDTSITGSFRTSPPPGTPFSYAIFGDTQLQGEGERVYFQEIFRNFMPDLTLIEGDLVSCDGNVCRYASPYDSLFSLAPDYFANTVLAPVPGNHDYLPVFKTMFSMLPDSGIDYLFQYGSAAFCMMTSDYGMRNTPIAESLGTSKADFKVGVSHNPPYYPTYIATYNYLWGFFFEAAGGNLWYSGHAHGYWRTRWMKSPDEWDWRVATGFPPDSVSDTERPGFALYCNGGSSWTPGSASDTLWSDYIVKADMVHPSYSIVTVDSVRPGVLNQKAYLYGTGLTLLDSFSVDHASQSQNEMYAGSLEKEALTCHPMPFHTAVSFERHVRTVEIFDIAGRKMVSLKGPDPVWRPVNVANGVYAVKAVMENGKSLKRLLLKQ